MSKINMLIKKNSSMGFTLIEVMIVVAILGIISAIAIPSYTEYVRKGKRTDGKVELLRIAQLQESFFVQNLSYAKTLGANTTTVGGLGLGTSVKSEQEEYDMSIVATPTTCTGLAGANACTGFTLKASGNGAQANDKCGNFTITNTGVKDVLDEDTGVTVKSCW